ncbi:M20/M25/M40 family metallo-hydrolase [Actinokineospora guangxiensis]|uniref:M20/M25/M40 family metallo-hydrolase n=1 Tax=Actinokineospora guangxiensis TaxID=1490288 RepID=A0ABW0ETD8_9PSEU
MRNGVVALVLLAVMGVVGTLAVLAFQPPSPVADAPPERFSAGRAEAHLAQIAQRPHPIGTADNERVRGYIADTARSLGADVTEETDQVVVQRRGVTRVATVHNVIAEVRGTAPGAKALLLLSHHDSVPTGPGAADDGAAVAAMLETLRALRTTPVPNTVRFVFTDGEEVGLLGAEAYVRRHGVADLGAVLNFEARGGGGPVWMFQTGPGSSGLIDAFGEASSRPIANSLAVEVYQRMPNSTDFTVFIEAGAPGLNSAFIERVHHYHAPTDDLVHLDRGSVQHHGETMLGLVRALGDADFEPGGASVYFDLFSRVLVHYPAWLAYALAGLTVAGLAAALVRVRPSATGTAAVAAASVGALLAAGALSLGVWWVVSSTRGELAFLPLSEPYNRGWFVAGFAVLGLAVLAAAVRLVRGRSRAELVAGPLVFTAVLLVVTVVAVPGASFLFQWPLLAALPALWWAGSERAGLWLAGAGPLVAAAVYPPLVGTLLVALGMPLVAVGVVFALLAGVLLVPVLAEVPRPAAAVLVPLVAAVALLASGVAGVGFDRESPRPDSLVYLVDDAGAHWLTPDPSTGPWTAKVLGPDPERVDLSERFPVLDEPVLRAPAPRHDLPKPTAEVLERTAGEVRLRVAPSPSAWRTQVALPGGCRVGEEPVGTITEVYGGPAEFTCAVTGALRVELTDHWIGLPEPAAAIAGPRPDDSTLVPSGTRLYDSALVGTVVTL